jgi:hypothetical protein
MKVEFLRDLLCSDSIYIGSNITVHNLEPISTFLGKIGNPQLGGLSLEEFEARQRLHRQAEIEAMRDVASFIAKAKDIYRYAHFINDMGGSVCELDDDDVLEILAQHTLIIYVRPGKDMEDKLITRQIENPKPLYYQENFFESQLAEYLRQEDLKEVEDIDPDKFVRWIFPKLVAHRRPLYQAIADQYGYTVEARDAEKVQDEADFIRLICETLEKQVAA